VHIAKCEQIPVYQQSSLTLHLLFHYSIGPYLGPNASGLHGRHDSLSGNLTGRFESLERILQQTFSALASYNVHLIEVIRALDHETLTAAMEVGSLPQPTNAYAESIAHMVSRRGNARVANFDESRLQPADRR
jgi:hypothetical protein